LAKIFFKINFSSIFVFADEHPDVKCYVVSQETFPRLVDGIEIWPAKLFLSKLWKKELFLYQ
jgi:hypothetical protein